LTLLQELQSKITKITAIHFAPLHRGHAQLRKLGKTLIEHLHENAMFRTNVSLQANDFGEGVDTASQSKYIINSGVVPKLDKLRNVQRNELEWMDAYVELQREKTEIKTLKIGFNRNSGYYLAASKGAIKKGTVPDVYVKKQSLASEVRYGTPELDEVEKRIGKARAHAVELEIMILQGLVGEVAKAASALREAARHVAQCDVLCGFAEVALLENYCRPSFTEDSAFGIDILDGRHPVVEQSMDAEGGEYQPNSARLGQGENASDLILLTGPNASGKSCFLRQTALIQILAQVGCFVPAKKATLSIADAVFTRVGAVDDLASGRSTFVVEMGSCSVQYSSVRCWCLGIYRNTSAYTLQSLIYSHTGEVATILRTASPASLVLLDEVGRGTSTQEGLAIAQAVAEHLAEVVMCKTIFATHYHELNDMEHRFSNVGTFSLSAQDYDGHLLFDHKVHPGGTTNSFGIEVAKLTGLPIAVIERARVLSARSLERESKY
jgi:DNA mismatch repair protein MutS